MKRALAWLGCAAALLTVFAAPARAQDPVETALIIMPMRDARALIARTGAAVGVGVYPPSRSAQAFLNQIGEFAPDPTEHDSPLARAMLNEGIVRRATLADKWNLPTMRTAHLLASLCCAGALPTRDFVMVESTDVPGLAAEYSAGRWDRWLVVGVDRSTPVLVAELGASGILTGGTARRPGVVTPYDITATVMQWYGLARPVNLVGKPLGVQRRTDGLARADGLAARMERDTSFGPPLTGATVFFAMPFLVAAVGFAWRRRRALAAALLRGSVMSPLGYVLGLFVPSGRWYVRAIPLAVLFAAGIAWRHPHTRKHIGAVLVATSALVSTLTAFAAAHPGGVVANSLWGNPLVSWRFFGLQNFLTSFVTGGAVAGLILLEAPLWLCGLAGSAALAVVGSPHLGANFIAVLTLGFGVASGVIALRRRTVRFWDAVPAALFALAATFLAFWSDAGSPVSHGGRAARTIESGGIRAAWSIFSERARLNYQQTVGIRVFGPIAFVLFFAALAWLLWWASRPVGDVRTRAAVWGAGAAALAALFMEDSGFLTGMILGFYPALAFAAWLTEDPMVAAPVVPVPPDVGVWEH